MLPGRRNNPPEPGVRAIACYNPIHFFELPELFMEFICQHDGQITFDHRRGFRRCAHERPFNALPPIIDLNNAFVSWLLTESPGFVTASRLRRPESPRGSRRQPHRAGSVLPHGARGARCAIPHRQPLPRQARRLRAQRQKVLASRLGYRINARFVHYFFFGRVFNHPHAVFTDAMLRPELQDLDIFADGMDNIVTTQKRVAQMYFDDGSIAQACPPLKALLHIMLNDEWEGKGLDHQNSGNCSTREYLMASDWYAARLAAKQRLIASCGSATWIISMAFCASRATRTSP